MNIFVKNRPTFKN